MCWYFGDRTFGEELVLGKVVSVRRDTRDLVLYLSPPPPTRPAASLPGEEREKTAECKPGRELSTEPDHAGSPILNFQPPEQ